MTPRNFFPIQDSTLDSRTLSELVLRRYRIAGPIRCHYFSFGLNDTYLVCSRNETTYMRIYRYRWRTRQEIKGELDLLLYLKRRGLSVSVPIKRMNGRFINHLDAPEGVRYGVLFTSARGHQQTLDDQRSRKYGDLVAQIHDATDRTRKKFQRFSIDSEHLLHRPIRSLEPFLRHRERDLRYVQEVALDLESAIESRLSTSAPEYGICHGDLHGENLHVDKSGQLTLFDFDCCGYGWRAYDLSVFLWSRVSFADWSRNAKANRTRRWNAFLDGYTKIRQLKPSELEAAMLFVPIRHIWMMGLHTNGTQAWGRDWINDRYFDRCISFIKNWLETYKVLS